MRYSAANGVVMFLVRYQTCPAPVLFDGFPTATNTLGAV